MTMVNWGLKGQNVVLMLVTLQFVVNVGLSRWSIGLFLIA